MPSLRTLMIAAAGLGLAGCTDGYGYSGVALGYSNYGGYAGYYDDYYGGYGRGYANWGNPYWGWYGDYYYPGTGYYVYDAWRRPHRWNDGQRAYWEGRRHDWRGDRRQIRDNWRDYDRDRRQDGRAWSDGRRGDRHDLSRGQASPEQFRRDRGEAERVYNRAARPDRQRTRSEGRRSRPR